jgi:hypothetical protein
MSFRPVILLLAGLSLWTVFANTNSEKAALPKTTPVQAKATAPLAVPVATAPITSPPAIVPTVAPKPIPKTMYVSGTRVALRLSPDPKSEVLDRLNDGFQIRQIEKLNDWIKVRHPLTLVEGYVSASRLRDTMPEKKEKKIIEKHDKAKVVLTAAAITAILIAASVAEYRSTRPCACPYNETRTGKSCGGRSAWSRPGGAAPLCYASDITPAMIASYRAGQR